MAYDLSQRKLIAHEYARSGGNVAKAVQRLRDEYESFRTIGETTVHRLSQESGFAELVAERMEIIAQGEAEARLEIEREKARREAEGTLLDRLAHDERILDEARAMFEGAVERAANSGEVKLGEALRAFAALTRIIDRRKERALPAIGEDRQAHAFVESVSETLQSELGPTRAPGVLKRIKETYLERCAEMARAEPA